MTSTKHEIVKHLIKNAQPSLKYFTEPSSKLDEKKFKEIVHESFNLQDHKLDMQLEKKIDQIVRKGYQDYLKMYELVSKGIHYSYKIIHTSHGKVVKEQKEIIDECLEKIKCHFTCINNLCSFQLSPPEEHRLDIPDFIYINNSRRVVLSNNTALILNIANSNGKDINFLINQTKDINKHNLIYGNNPILLSIAKGYNHADTDHKGSQPSLQQKNIINKLLKREDLDINCIHLGSGMTPLHIACLRGDSPELITKLLDRGADPTAADYQGNKPIDLCGSSYKDVQTIIERMSGEIYKFGDKKYNENQSLTATLLTREERERAIFKK